MTDQEQENIAAEEALIGKMLFNPTIIDEVFRIVVPEMFASSQCRELFKAIGALHTVGTDPDDVQLVEYLNKTGAMPAAGGAAEVSRFRWSVATAEDWTEPARIIAEKYERRGTVDLARDMMRAISQGEDLHEIRRRVQLEISRANGTALTGDARFIAASMTGPELLAADITKPESLLGDHLLVEGGSLVLHGKPGLGKTWGTLQLAIALANGQPWFGLPTKQCIVGIIELEMHEWFIRDRLIKLIDGTDLSLENIRILARPRLKGPVNLLDDTTRRGIASWCRKESLGVFALDALSRFHSGDETRDMPLISGAVDRLREEGEAAGLLVHHDRKGGTTRKEREAEDDMDAARGGSKLMGDHGGIRFKSYTDDGTVEMVVTKTNLGPKPEPVFLRRGQYGILYLDDEYVPPAVRGDERQKAVRDILVEQGDKGATVRDIMVVLQGTRDEMSKSVIYRVLEQIGANRGKGYRYFLDVKPDEDLPF